MRSTELMGPIPSDAQATIESLFKKLLGVPEEHRGALGAAVDLHYAAVLLHDLDLNAAYALAVAGIETLSRHFGDLRSDWSDWAESARFDRVFDELALLQEQRDRLRQEMLADRQLRLRQGFAQYASERLPDDFWTLNVRDFVPNITMTSEGVARFEPVSESDVLPIERLVPVNRSLLRRRLLAAYDARSAYVHEGGQTVNAWTSLLATIPMPASAKTPIEFAGLRRILTALIERELTCGRRGRSACAWCSCGRARAGASRRGRATSTWTCPTLRPRSRRCSASASV